MIGVVGDDAVAAAVEEAGFDVRVGPASGLTSRTVQAVVTVGESALIDLVDAGIDRPVLPVALEAGLPSVAVGDAGRAIEAFEAGEAAIRRHTLLDVAVDDDPVGRAVFDVMLVRSEPGRISEYGLVSPAAESRFRADGVVAATPAGSRGYAHAAGGPRLGRDVDAVAVVPVAPFGLGAPTWVLDPDAGFELRVERDEGDVSLLVDGRERRTFAGETTVALAAEGSLETIDPSLE